MATVDVRGLKLTTVKFVATVTAFRCLVNRQPVVMLRTAWNELQQIK